jgi:peptide methionine sulfoxide reductase MsrB
MLPLPQRAEETEATAYRKYATASSRDTEFPESQVPWKQKEEGVYMAFLLGPLQFLSEAGEPYFPGGLILIHILYKTEWSHFMTKCQKRYSFWLNVFSIQIRK